MYVLDSHFTARCILLIITSVESSVVHHTRVIQLLEGSDGIAQAALINVSNEAGPPRILKRSTRHLISIEVSCEDDEANVPPVVDLNKNSCDPSKDNETIADASNSSAHSPNNLSRPR